MKYADKLPDNLKETDIVDSSPWPANSILDYTSINSHSWGKLIFFIGEGGEMFYHFSSELPAPDDIEKRWGKFILKLQIAKVG